MNNILYFAYGANCNIASMSERCPDAILLGNARLYNYSLQFRHHADVELSIYESVFGMLWSIDHNTLDLLDDFESYPSYYNRQEVVVEHNDNQVEAWVYIMNDQTYVSPPSNGYLNLCADGYLENNLPYYQLESALYECNQ